MLNVDCKQNEWAGFLSGIFSYVFHILTNSYAVIISYGYIRLRMFKGRGILIGAMSIQPFFYNLYYKFNFTDPNVKYLRGLCDVFPNISANNYI